MPDREKLIALLDAAREHADRECDWRDDCSGCPGDTMRDYCQNPTIADHLIANGVVVREKGEWVKQWCDNNLIGHEYEDCPFCGCEILDTEKFWDAHFCPNCGADMTGGDRRV